MFASVKRVPDILPAEGHTGQDAYDLTMKQLTALGCPHWDSDGSFFGKGPQPHLTAGPLGESLSVPGGLTAIDCVSGDPRPRDEHQRLTHVHIYCFTTDGGPDQRVARRICWRTTACNPM